VSYLNPTRIHFAGQFRADVSTVNNFPPHYDNSKFVSPNDQLPGGSGGWWQPAGTGAWKIDRCAVTGAVLNGKAVNDPVVGLQIRDSGDKVSAKLVDLDPEQQMVSMIFGLEVRIVDPVSKRVLMRGDFTPAPFYDIWTRAIGNSGDSAFSAIYQSVLTGVEWGDLEGSAVLQGLKAASEPGLLSILFNVDSYALRGTQRGFGRMVGTIGPQIAGDPIHFVAGRHLAPLGQTFGNQPAPISQVGSLGFVTCWLDQANRKLIADFGNAVPTGGCGLADVGALHLLCLQSKAGGRSQTVLDLGRLQNYSAPGWYERTAGIQAFPPLRPLTDDEMAAVAANQLCVASPSPGDGFFIPLAMEAPDGVFARPDLFVYRMEPGVAQDVPVMALQFGQPLAGATITTQVIVSGSQPDPSPPSALSVANTAPIETGSTGWAAVTLLAENPGTPRITDGRTGDGIDGQVYTVNVGVAGAASAGNSFDPDACFVSILVFSKFEVPASPGWSDVRPILKQYSNLYPRPHGPDRYEPYDGVGPLHPVVNLSKEEQVRPFAPMIARALQLPSEHPNHMPVPSDLSPDKRRALLGYVQGVMSGTSDLLTGPAEPAAAAGADSIKPAQAPARNFAAARAAPPGVSGGFEPEEELGSKTVARLRAAALRRPAGIPMPEEK
jgi:hypothetical protein